MIPSQRGVGVLYPHKEMGRSPIVIFAARRSSRFEVFVALRHAHNKLLISGVILISPSFPSGFPPPCPIGVQSSHHAGLTLHLYKSF